MVQVEELEGRFAEFDEYIEELTRKREEIYEAFEGRKQALIEQRNRRAGNLLKSAERILAGLKHRAASLDDINTINGYFAGDLMVSKLRDIIAELRDIGDTVKADDLQTRLKTLQDDAVRQLKDRKELFVDGGNVLKFGTAQFFGQHAGAGTLDRPERGNDVFPSIRHRVFRAGRERGVPRHPRCVGPAGGQ